MSDVHDSDGTNPPTADGVAKADPAREVPPPNGDAVRAAPAPAVTHALTENQPAPAASEEKSAQAEPKVEPAKIEPAKVEAAKVEAPKVEAPKAEAPKSAAPEPVAAPAPEIEFSNSLFRRRASLQSPKQALQPQEPPAPPKKKKRREGTLSAASGLMSFLLLALVAGAFGLIAVQHKLKDPGPLAADKVLYFPPRTDVPEMLAQLEREGVIDSPLLMNIALLMERARDRVKPGEYLFKQKISLREVMDQLVSGRQLLHGVTIPEGLTSEQVVQRLRDNDVLAGEILETPKEGALLPETYKVARAYPRSKLIAKMQDDQRKLVDQIWAKRSRELPLKTPYELVTLASIVEKETGKAEERPRVAAVYLNRLRKGMRLQSDPTIVYGLVGGKATLGRGILRSEVEKWTPYNTYTIDGLPPGPIANPGKAALEATANPLRTQELYFVADGTGGHVFAETLEQHARNVQRWRQIEQNQKDQSGGADRAPLGAPAPAAPPPVTPKGDRRGDAGLGRFVDMSKPHEDYSAGRAMAEDDGPTHRLGRYAQREAAFALGGFDDPTRANARGLAALRRARAFFTEQSAQLRPANVDPSLFAVRRPSTAADDGEDDLAMAQESADGRALPDAAGGDVASYPVSPKLRAEQKARAARLGLSAGSDKLPPEVIGEREPLAPATPEGVAALASPAQAAAAGRPARPRAFDASEGTALDPLKDKSWDLSSAKTVPTAAPINYR